MKSLEKTLLMVGGATVFIGYGLIITGVLSITRGRKKK